MTPEAQQIAIAKACGWKDVKYTYHEEVDIENRSIIHWSGLTGIPPEFTHYENRVRIPDYLNDLNAVHDFVSQKFKSKFMLAEYEYRLRACLADGRPTFEVAGYELANATAAQRAEALLKALNLWKESK
jgi:hypothetical protein